MYYIYILKSTQTKKLYIGYTNGLRRRLKEHNSGISKATKHYAPYELIYYEAYRSKKDAIEREKKLKMFRQGYRWIKERIKHSLIGS